MSRRPLKFGVSLQLGGQRVALLGVDIPVAWFFWGLPDRAARLTAEGSGRRRLHAEVDRWAEAVLTRGVYLGSADGLQLLTPDLVQRLGSQRETAVLRYLSAVGWLAPGDEQFLEEAEEPPPVELPPLAIATGDLHRAFTAMPVPYIRQALREVAEGAHTPPHVIWREWTISEFAWTWCLIKNPTAPPGEASAPVERPVADAAGVGAAKTNVIPMRWPASVRAEAGRAPMPSDETLLAMMRVGLERES